MLDDFIAAEAEGRLGSNPALVYSVPVSLVDDGLMRETKAS
jgi:hypothetical protein